MARIKRVSNKAVARQKRANIWKSKKFWIIASLAIILVAAAIVIPVVLVNLKSKDTVHDYFKEYQSETVKFENESYDGILNYIKDDYVNPQNNKDLSVDDAFVFFYTSTSFHPVDEEPTSTDDEYSKEDEALFENLVKLQTGIDTYNKSHNTNIKLFIVDCKYSFNISVNTDSVFGSLFSESEPGVGLVYVKDGEYYEYYDNSDGKIADKPSKIYLSSNTTDTNGTAQSYIKSTLVNNILYYLSNLYEA